MTLVSPLTSPQDSVMLEFDKFQSDNRSTGMLRLDISPDREDWETLQLYRALTLSCRLPSRALTIYFKSLPCMGKKYEAKKSAIYNMIHGWQPDFA